MPSNRNLTIAYAGVASLAAITLVYVFSPSFAIDNNNTSSSQRQKGVVGLVNTANDCFINSVLQALAGLPELREYLIHRTRIAKENGEFLPQKPFLSGALKEILDSLNEKPIRRKTISARPFLTVLERIFRQKISRAQQDAQEFLQVVAEKLAEEYHDMHKFNKKLEAVRMHSEAGDAQHQSVTSQLKLDMDFLAESGMPLEGTLESEIECQRCKYKTKPNLSKFVVLTLTVPHKASATLNECIDGAFMTEYIDDFQCDKCRLLHAIAYYEAKLSKTSSQGDRDAIQDAIQRLQHAVDGDPQTVPAGVQLPPSSPATRSRIAKRTRMSSFPPVIVIHLSRSIYDQYLSSRKNICKVSFPEKLSMGGLLDRRGYKLQCLVTHKGGHDSGHYECFRRQIVYPPPFSNPHLPSTGNSPTSTPTISVMPSASTTNIPKQPNGDEQNSQNAIAMINGSSTPTDALDKIQELTSSPKPLSLSVPSETFEDRPKSSSSLQTTMSAATVTEEASPLTPTVPTSTAKVDTGTKRKKTKRNNKWWRISDEKVKEAKTEDVLAQQKEVYLLFYERIRENR
ncbi:hypothetical protein BDZ91DRAFT_692970 [Kalaharituber pfeilii]|nr:hypothetical protein BDZ91DRAFT_692970 [Kalaharituber pfeilii]